MCTISIKIENDGLITQDNLLYQINGGLIAPGVILLQGVSRQKGDIIAINYTDTDVHFPRGIPFATAQQILEDEVMFPCESSSKLTMCNEDVYTLMALSYIT